MVHDEWEGGRPLGLAWRRLIAGTTVAVVVALSWFAVQSDQGLRVQTDRNPMARASAQPDVILHPPTRAGARWICPPDHPVRAYTPGVYFPPEHPAVPSDTRRPEGCLLSAQWAQEAGYNLAAAPPDAVMVGSLYLVPALSPTVHACGAVAAVVGFDVPCPQRLPAPGRGMTCASSCLFYGEAARPGVVIEQRDFLRPVQWCEGCEAHVVVAAVHDRTPAELVTCGPQMARAAEHGARIAGYHDCGPGPEWLPGIAGYPHERHTLLVWEDGPVTFAVSMHGHGAPVRSVLTSLRNGIITVAPR